ncbi:DUF4124 domain-containing protein [Dokdonella sp.]|uniref:DUF4124 domain-containing protein n=1 Tax=Dokdonella sp. TaxID=2291710 RepID=UPI002F3FC5CD
MRERRRQCRYARLCAGTLLLLAAVAHADSVYRCRNARGEVAYQDHACATGEQQAEVALDPLPAAAPAAGHERALETHGRSRSQPPARAGRRPRGPAGARSAMSWECRAADGEVFYRHGACPKSIAASHGAPVGTRRGGSKGSGAIGVTASPLPRAEACRRLEHPGGRNGREHDETVSTYERNAGRDPCRRH